MYALINNNTRLFFLKKHLHFFLKKLDLFEVYVNITNTI